MLGFVWSLFSDSFRCKVVVVLQSQSRVWLCDTMNCSTTDFPVLQNIPELLKLISIESAMPSNHLILCFPLLLLPSVFPSIKVFSSESALFSGQGKEIEGNNRIRKTRDLFKKIREAKGTFHAKMGTVKDRNIMDLTEAEDIKKMWQEYPKELYEKKSAWPR